MPKENWKRAFFIMMLALILGMNALFISMVGKIRITDAIVLVMMMWSAGFFIQLLFIMLLQAMGYTIVWEAQKAFPTVGKNDDQKE